MLEKSKNSTNDGSKKSQKTKKLIWKNKMKLINVDLEEKEKGKRLWKSWEIMKYDEKLKLLRRTKNVKEVFE